MKTTHKTYKKYKKYKTHKKIKNKKRTTSRRRKIHKKILKGGYHDDELEFDNVNIQAERQANGMYNVKGDMDLN